MAVKRKSSSSTIGLDIGYGVVKAVISGMSPVLFPSVWGNANDIKFQQSEITAKYPGDQITDEDGKYFVGELALSQLRSGDQRRLRGRTADEQSIGNVARRRLMKVALGKLFPNIKSGDVHHFRVATGLPVDHMRGSQDLKDALLGQHLINTDNTYFIANVTEVMVMPQPYGTIYRNLLTDSGEINPCHTYTRTGTCDIGTYTIDVALDDDGEYIDKQSGSVEAGVYTIQEAVAEAFERQFNQKPTYKDVETILRKRCIRAFGEPVDFSEEVLTGVTTLRDATLQLMSDKWGNGATVDVIYVAGGGAGLIIDDIKAVYRQAKLVDDFQTSNAQGYLNYALSTDID
jgi:hypothetical protein